VKWVPHPGLAEEVKGKEGAILAGRGEEADEQVLGVVHDGYGEQLASLERFPYDRYGIRIV
jgi:pseudouridine 5'-phosphatase